MTWNAWSQWSWRAKADLDDDEYAQLVREARYTQQVEIKNIGSAWAIVSNGLQLDAGWSREEMRRQCQRMGWRYL
jgi:hypothetical protein